VENKRCKSCFETLTGDLCPRCGYPHKNAAQFHQLPVGTILAERYQIGRVLGQGGFGITYLGWDMMASAKVAIKEFYPSSIVNRDTSRDSFVRCNTADMEPYYQTSLQRFLREAKALTKYRDIPEIVDIYDFLEENGTAYIVMEYVQGMDLASYVQKKGGKLSTEETFRILKPVMEALAEVHKGGSVHRDISPDNIVLHPTGGAKLLDFGAVRTVINPDADKELSHSTEAILKHGFAPMEQYHSRGSLGPWTDEYAMCATVWYCLTGQIPDNAPTRVVERTNPDWSQIPGLTRSQRYALRKGLSVRSKDRYPDMDELIEDLFQPELTLRLPERKNGGNRTEHPPRKHDPVRRNHRWILPASVAAVAAIAVLLVVLWPQSEAERDIAEAYEPAQLQETLDTALVQEYLDRADALAQIYDYDGAIAVLDSWPGEQPYEIRTRKAHYQALRAALVEWNDYSSIPNLSFHPLIADPSRAFSDKDLGAQYSRNFITVDEFSRILEQLYANGYVLVSFDSFTERNTDAQGNEVFSAVPILLPEGKKPLMLTQTLCNYFSYMVDSDDDGSPDAGGDGFAYQMIVDNDGKIKSHMIQADGEHRTGSFDFVPVLEDFLEAHPDFSYHGSRATLALTGYEGIFGHRMATQNGNSGSEAEMKQLIDFLRQKGYTIACNTYGNEPYGDMNAIQIQVDLEQWVNRIVPLIGEVDTLVYARSSEIGDYSGAKFQVLYGCGFRCFLCPGAPTYGEINNSHIRQSCLMVTGENIAWNSDQFSGLFDCADILNDLRGSIPKG